LTYTGTDGTIGPDGVLRFVPKPGAGPIEFEVTRFYPLAHLMTLTGDVRAIIVVGNDGYLRHISGPIRDIADVEKAPATPGLIVADDSRKAYDGRDLDLNSTIVDIGFTVRFKHLAGETFHGGELPAEPEQPQLRPATQVNPAPSVEAVSAETTGLEDLTPTKEEKREEMRILYVVKAGLDGKESEPHRLPDDALADLAGLFEKFKQKGLPDGRYRIYLKEVGYPKRMLIEFYKAGNSFGEPSREQGPGANPVREEAPAVMPQGGNGNQAPKASLPSAPVADQSHWRSRWPEEEDAAAPDDLPDRAAHPAVRAAVLALTSFALSGAPGRWATVVDTSLQSGGRHPFTPGARLRRRLRRADPR
jgi:hypothetical protein